MHNRKRHRLKTLHWLLLAVVLLMLCVYPSHIQAQQTIDMRRWSRLIYTSQSDISLSFFSVWDSSSRWFWAWEVQYDTQTGQVTQDTSNRPSSQTTLPTTILAAFGIDTSEPDYPRAYYSVSPNGEYVAYSVVVNDGKAPPYDNPKCVTREIRVGHVPSLTIKTIDLQVSSGVNYTWYGESTGLLISSTSPCAGEGGKLYSYITSFSPNLKSLNTTDVSPWEMHFDGIEMYFDRVLHVSRDGTQVLLLGSSFPTGDAPHSTPALILLDVKTPSNTRILFQNDQIPNSAFFKYGDETRLLLITADGFIEYDLNTKQTTMLDSNFNGILTYTEAGGGIGVFPAYNEMDKYYVYDSTISPNGRWLIYAHWDIKNAETSYYVVDLAEALYANGTTGNATPTNLPTFTPVCSSDGC